MASVKQQTVQSERDRKFVSQDVPRQMCAFGTHDKVTVQVTTLGNVNAMYVNVNDM